ncbi:DNA-binding MarR family transcriptional regulator [Actinopolyspora biskrensis]|uniref:DNA-binding MarR family transcriptional regulator n=1 Tax=Actinopolyspora biskrensis TaxID=1470178 RepID=A0A852YUH6_9ACTN|nr:MarR family winged helix-turn-helix transcriptional regulator [Actinopolyspora biskrensis]NYH77392.1 DNA-binding MarR family transcriptional regulator [Actinopolyspora biskrensis]
MTENDPGDRSTRAEQAPPDAADEIAEAWSQERPGTPVESIGVVTRLWRLAKLFGEDRRRVLSDSGVDSATLDLLSVIRRSSTPYRLTTRQLSELTLVSAGAISQRVAKAERDGLVVRWPDPGPDRCMWVELTRTGHALVERTVDRVLSRELELLQGLDHEQRHQLGDLLRTLLRDVQARQGDHGVSHVGETGTP